MSDRDSNNPELAADRDLISALRAAVKLRKRTDVESTFRATTLLENIGIGVEPSPATTPKRPSRRKRKTLVEAPAEARLLSEASDDGPPLRDTLPADEPEARTDRVGADPEVGGPPAGDTSAGDDEAPAPDARSYGRFEPRSVLGEGSMGVVLEAWDPELGRTVALKLIRNAHAVSDTAVQRFVAEARVTAQLDHPGIVPVHELGVTSDGVLFFVMKKVRGRSMREILDAARDGDPLVARRWTRHRLLSAFGQIGQALAYAHERGVVHRDLKPENIMLGDYGEVVVMDWGVARIPELTRAPATSTSASTSGDHEAGFDRSGSGRLTLHGTAVGTPGFMSPEAALGERDRLGPHSDVWSLGAILFELLTDHPAYEGHNAVGLMRAVIEEPPPDPAERFPRAGIPRELADVCVRALDPRPSERGTARELAEAIEAYLEGSAARALADRRLAEGREAWQRHGTLLREHAEAGRRIRQIERVTPPWTPPAQKRELLELRSRDRELQGELADTFENVVAACERALSHDRRCVGAHELLAEAYLYRLEDARERGDEVAARVYARRVRAHDVGEATLSRVDAAGRISLRTTSGHAEDPDAPPLDARVRCQRVRRRGLVWELDEPVDLGTTPLRDVELAAGSYVLTLSATGMRDTTYPVLIEHGRSWVRDHPLPLYTDAEIGDGWCYVPRGPFVCGGDPRAVDAFPRSQPSLGGFFVQSLPVTAAAYASFLDALHQQDPDAAWRRVPREVAGHGGALGQHWHRPARDEGYVVPAADRGGDPWSPLWPVIAVSWDDAQAYAAWRGERFDEICRLPLELEWEKAARGVDGRAFPWGDEFDATLCLMRDSRPINRLPENVGTFESDRSVYGVRDMAGSVGEWCGEASHRGDGARRLVRGGSWLGGVRRCRVASRDVLDLSWVYPSVGFRLLREACRG